MGLEKLEVFNFKSYCGKQTIGPFSEFTAVIGPNGAGKSNLMDAISFVLGVKSVHLRSSRVQDLIYRSSNTSSSSPPGDENDEDGDGSGSGNGGTADQPKKASVTAFYIDQKNDEYQYKRTVSQDGSSAYHINGKPVSQKDYIRSLEKEHILVNVRNFLVFQGDVEAIASQSSKDLTRLIEQVSGSWALRDEYERLKAEHELATEESNAKFTKKRGIQSEIRACKAQKTELDRFEKLREERDLLIMEHLMWKLFVTEKKVMDAAEHGIKASEKIVEAKEKHSREVSGYNESKKKLADKYKEILKAERSIKTKSRDIDSIKPDLVSLAEKIKHAELSQNRGNDGKRKLEKDMERQTNIINTLNSDLDAVNKSQVLFEQELKDLETSKGGVVFDKEMLNEYTALRGEANKQSHEQRQLIETLTRRLKVCGNKTDSARSKRDDLNARRCNLEERKSNLNTQLEQTKELIKQRQLKYAQINNQLKTVVAERESINKRTNEIEEKLTITLNQLMTLRSDFNESERQREIREITSTLKAGFPGVYGRLSDLIQPSSERNALAINIALGRHLDAIIVERQSIAIECIKHLRDNRIGHAPFIPLDTINAPPPNDKFRTLASGAHLAVDLMRFDKSIERAVHYACGNVIICDSLNLARDICFNRDIEVKAITVDGNVIHRSGLMTGGRGGLNNNSSSSSSSASRNTSGLTVAQVAAQISNCERARDRLKQELVEINQQRSTGSAELDLQSELSNVNMSLRVAQDEKNTIERSIVDIDKEMADIDVRIVKADELVENFERDSATLQSQFDDVEREINVIDDQIFGGLCQRAGISNIRVYEREQLSLASENAEKLMQFKTQINRLQTQIDFEQKTLNDMENRLERIKLRANEENQNLQSLREQYQEKNGQIGKIKSRVNEIVEELRRVKKEYDLMSDNLAQLKATVNEANSEVVQARKDRTHHRTEVDRLLAERMTLLQKCRVENIQIPLKNRAKIDDIPLNTAAATNDDDEDEDNDQERDIKDENAMDIDRTDENDGDNDDPETVADARAAASFTRLLEGDHPFGEFEVNYNKLKFDGDDAGDAEVDADYERRLREYASTLERLNPNMHAAERLDVVEQQMADNEDEFTNAKNTARSARDSFNEIQQRRYRLFYDAFTHIAERIDPIYKELTRIRATSALAQGVGISRSIGGTAYLSMEDTSEPYLHGVKYHAMPPMKRFRDMEQLSGGEKTVAALALLFAIHSYKPAPFFVLDEVDAALDNVNVARVAKYIRDNCGSKMQFIVISLKADLYDKADSLVGIYRDQGPISSRVLTLDLTQYPAVAAVAVAPGAGAVLQPASQTAGVVVA